MPQTKKIDTHINNISDKVSKSTLSQSKRLKLAYISPLPPARSGISDYSAVLLPELYHYYDIDVVVDQEEVSDEWIQEHCAILDAQTFKENSTKYDRVLYNFGNSDFHNYMFNLLIAVPGVVVLHDFYLSGVINHMNCIGYENHSFHDDLYYSHGNAPFNRDGYDLVAEYPSNKRVLDYAKGVIVHSENSKRLAKEWYGKLYGSDWSVIPLVRKPFIVKNRNESRKELDIRQDAIVIAGFGHLGATKLNIELLNAWLDSSIAKNENSLLIFVGESKPGEYWDDMQNIIKDSPFSDRIKITGWIDTVTFNNYLSAADIGVQLRTFSRGETSAAVLDCMNYGLATIVNANGSMADLPQEAVWMLPDEFDKTELIEALETLYNDENKRKLLGEKAMHTIREEHAPKSCAKQYALAIEAYDKTIIRKDGMTELRVAEAWDNYMRISNSFSYRITKPLRTVRSFIGSLLGEKTQ